MLYFISDYINVQLIGEERVSLKKRCCQVVDSKVRVTIQTV